MAATDVMGKGTYTGEIVGSKANGKGKITFENGDDWVGMFKDNKWYGNGILHTKGKGNPIMSRTWTLIKFKFMLTQETPTGYIQTP